MATSAVLVIVLSGCGGDDLGCVPVTGNVTFADGVKIDQYAIKNITLEPVDIAQGTRKASGTIMNDGSFVLMTRLPNDGAIPGSYTVSCNFSHYPRIPADFAVKWEFEPAKVEVS